MTPQLPPGFVLDTPPLPAGFVLDGATPQAPNAKPGASWADVPVALAQEIKDRIGGAVRGAGSIGATLMAPHDALQDAIERRLTGKDQNRNVQRRQDMTDATRSLGANPESINYGVGKLVAEVAGTAGVGNVLAGLVRATPIAARIPNVVEALSTAGMRGGGIVPRAVGGAVTGGAAAGLVNPEDAGKGAVIGGSAPVVSKVAGAVGHALGRTIRGPEQSSALQDAIRQARESGYVIPPSQAKPSIVNRTLEGFSGKITTAQNASAKNQAVTNKLAAEAIGLPADTQITPDTLKAVRDAAGQAYEAIGQSGVVRPGQAYDDALDKIVKPHLVAAGGFPNAKPSPVITLVDSLRSEVFDAASAVAKIKELRSAADDAFRTGNTDIGRASKAASKALEDAIEAHLQSTGQAEMLASFKAARELIAKTYSVEKALNPASGTVDARKLASELKKGKPLSGELRKAAEFGAQFPKAAQPVEGMGSLPQTSPLDWWALGGTSMVAGNPLPMLGVVARPAARAATLSPMVQNRLIQKNPIQSLINPESAQLGYRAAPIVLGPSSGR